MTTTLDAHGKTMRIGDTVHKLESHRTIDKGETNGRVLPEQKTFTVRRIQGDLVGLRESPRSKYTVPANEVVKE